MEKDQIFDTNYAIDNGEFVPLVVSGYRCEKHGDIELNTVAFDLCDEEYHNVTFCLKCLVDLLKDHLKPLEEVSCGDKG